MATERFPLGAAALHPDWPQARFNVSGMFAHHPLVVGFTKFMWTSFDCRLPVEAIHGAPAVPWNAGRPMTVSYKPGELMRVLEFFYPKGGGFFPTFTNHHITQADLANPICNNILDCISQRPDRNGVIVTSDLLSNYIANKYPALRQIASIIKVTMERGNGRADYYQELGKRFYRYVVHPDDCRNLKLLDQLDREKAEIILNENCVSNCPRRVQHYDVYARLQKATDPTERTCAEQELKQIHAVCGSPLRQDRLGNWSRSCNLARAEVKTIYDMGFRHFKLQGRNDDAFSFAYDLTRFMLEPESVGPLVYKFLCQWLGRVVVRNEAVGAA